MNRNLAQKVKSTQGKFAARNEIDQCAWILLKEGADSARLKAQHNLRAAQDNGNQAAMSKWQDIVAAVDLYARFQAGEIVAH